MTAPLLDVRNMSVEYRLTSGSVRAVDDVSFAILPGEFVGIVGESGSGKSTLAHGLLRLLPNVASQSGEVLLDGTDLSTLSNDEMSKVRGDRAGMVFQDPMTSFDPQRQIGYHLREALQAHQPTLSSEERHRIAVDYLGRTGLPEPEYQSRRYPHELSGGMRQRAMLALALENSPELIIADEPTTALDVTIQAQILSLFGQVLDRSGTSMILISHDLAVVRQVCSRILVMYAGKVVEDAPTEEVFEDPRHPYTQALISATPRSGASGKRLATIPGRPPTPNELDGGCRFRSRCKYAHERCETESPVLGGIGENRLSACFLSSSPLVLAEEIGADRTEEVEPIVNTASVIELRDIRMEFQVHNPGTSFRKERLHALRNVSLDIRRGETLGIVGESGSGKSTLARIILGLQVPTSGSVRINGENPFGRKSSVRREQKLQAVFQDPHGSLNPRMTIGETIAEPLRNLGVGGERRREVVASLLEEVQLPPEWAARYPAELSGGQAQRVAIARALAPEPDVMVLDEPTSGLDISIQAHILNLLADLQARRSMTYILISHDLTIVQHLADRIAVMYLGRVVEISDSTGAFSAPAHPYTVGLLAAVPEIEKPEKPKPVVAGEPPSPLNPPSGCSFHTRCPIARDLCAEKDPLLDSFNGQQVACHFPGELQLASARGPEGGKQ